MDTDCDGITLDVLLSSNPCENWLPALRIPAYEFTHFSSSPLRWLAYLGLAIVGRMGVLHHGPELTSRTVDLDDPFSINPTRSVSYYYRHEGDLCPAALDAELSSTSFSERNRRDSKFRRSLITRDESCVDSLAPEEDSEAAHLLRFSFGHEYIRNMTTRRQLCNDPIIYDINDVRNGLLLNSTAHRHLAKNVAILPVPNPFMNGDHAPSDQMPGYYLQQFIPSLRDHPFGKSSYPHNRPLRTPDSPEKRRQWPTLTIFTMVYGCVALKHWGCTEFADELRNNYDCGLYSSTVGTIQDGRHSRRKFRLARPKVQEGNSEEQAAYAESETSSRYDFRSHRDEPDLVELFLLLGFMDPSEQSWMEEKERRLREQREARQKEESEKKVREWLTRHLITGGS
ncbi:hypothetical protein OBBRIDRAFT_825422 [Obba rivulosa]|uniref:HNH nuclease domain-containing protein n=1 Tax=Obba rivulosa TaxID=1052685 RepID=A0A8E2DKA2_9APHY|nr:hypothetical protein OBBRIDRAFT_825422 [Obba rivulosa]